MRHGKKIAKLGRTASHRLAMLRTMVTQLIQHERIETTLPKAKALRPVAEKIVTLAKKGLPHHREIAQSFIRTPQMLDKLFLVLAPRYKFRPGGYTRILRTRHRYGDNTVMAYIEFIDRKGEIRKPTPCDEAYWRNLLEVQKNYQATQKKV